MKFNFPVLLILLTFSSSNLLKAQTYLKSNDTIENFDIVKFEELKESNQEKYILEDSTEITLGVTKSFFYENKSYYKVNTLL